MSLADIRKEDVDPLLKQIKAHMTAAAQTEAFPERKVNGRSGDQERTDTPFAAHFKGSEDVLILDKFVDDDNDPLNHPDTVIKQDNLLSTESVKASAAAFANLAHTAKIASQSMPQEKASPGLSTGDYTVEQLTRELLKPMLKEWLDAHLPSLVKWLVAEQIEKLTQQYQNSLDKTPD